MITISDRVKAVPAKLSFIVGGRRTGTTLLYQLICSSPDVHSFVSEFQLFTRLLDAFAWGSEHYDRMVKFFFRDRGRYEAYQARVLRILVDEALNALAPHACAVFKNPELSFHVEAVARIFPTACFVATIRDPRDQVASEREAIERQIRSGARTGSVPSPALLTTRFLAYYEPLLRLHEAEPHRLRFVRYEDLVTEPVRIMAEVAAFLDISADGIDAGKAWDFGLVDRLLMQARPSWSDLYGKPVTAERIGRYRTGLTLQEAKEIDRIAHRIGAMFHYGGP
jgi:hypothetical protein